MLALANRTPNSKKTFARQLVQSTMQVRDQRMPS
jgi:hypothetical protein